MYKSERPIEREPEINLHQPEINPPAIYQKVSEKYDEFISGLNWEARDRDGNPKESLALTSKERDFMYNDMKELILDYSSVLMEKKRFDYGLMRYEVNEDESVHIIKPTFLGMACRLSLDRLGEDIFDRFQKADRDQDPKGRYWWDLFEKVYKADDMLRDFLEEENFIPTKYRDEEIWNHSRYDIDDKIIQERNSLGIKPENVSNRIISEDRGRYFLPDYWREINVRDYKDYSEDYLNISPSRDWEPEISESIESRQKAERGKGLSKEYKRKLDVFSKAIPFIVEKNINPFEATDLEKRLSNYELPMVKKHGGLGPM